MSEIKFTDEEMTSLNDIQVKYRQIQMSMGALKLQQISHKTQVIFSKLRNLKITWVN